MNLPTSKNPPTRHPQRNGPSKLPLHQPDDPETNPDAIHRPREDKLLWLNRMDLLQREGHYPLPPQAPKTLGVEFSGVIEALGEKANETPPHRHSSLQQATEETKEKEEASSQLEWKVGDEVFGLAYGGRMPSISPCRRACYCTNPPRCPGSSAPGSPETWITATQAMYLIGGFARGKSILCTLARAV